MKYLLDTEIWLWSLVAPEKLNDAARAVLVDGETEIYLSAASAWEIAIKFALGKLPLPEPPARYVPSRMRRQGIRALPVTHTHALNVVTLPNHHKDPFDRLLVAQAKLEKMMLLTADNLLKKYNVKILWSG